jgi:hypothetical protein
MAANYSLGVATLGTQVDLSGLQAGVSQADGLLRGGLQQASSGALGFFETVFATGLGGVVTNAISGVVGLIGSLGGQLMGVAQSGFAFNNSMEQVTAQLNAFTKDGAASAEILEMIKTRAAATPFEFDAMAKAASALLPASKMAGVGLEQLIEQAEILAASNPAQGLEGAAFSLKEALSGDFASIIERFNLPRQYLNQLKAEGVPALEAVRMAMKQMGLDTDLVTNMAATFDGRMSTLKDTFTGFVSTITQPVFNVL